MQCPQCGQLNRTGGPPFCTKCGTKLPHLPDFEPAEVPQEHAPVDDRLRAVEEAVDLVLREEITPEELGTFLDELVAELVEREQELLAVEVPEAVEDLMREELELGLEGIAWFAEGLATMRQFVDDPVAEHLEAGLEIVRAANERLNEAMRLNRENRKAIDATYADTSTFL